MGADTFPHLSAPEGRESQHAWKWLFWLSALGLAIRMVYDVWIHPVGSYLYSDMQGAYSAGQSFADLHHTFTRWDFVKPRAMGFTGGFILRHFKHDGLVKWGWLQAFLRSVTVPLTYVGTFRFFGLRPAIVTTSFMSVNPLAISFASFLMVETYSTFFLSLSFALLVPKRPLLCFLSGLALGGSVLFKPQGMPVCALWCLLLFFWPSPGTFRRSFATWLFTPQRIAAVLLCLGTLTAVAREVVAVSKVIGKPTFLTPYSGQNFYIGHCNVKLMGMDGGKEGSFFAGVPKVYQRDEPWPDVTFHVPVFDSQFYMKEGMKCFRRSFPATLVWMARQLCDVFAGWPGSTIDPWPVPGGWGGLPRYPSVLLEYVLVPLGLWQLWRRRRDLGMWLAFAAPLGAIWGLAILFSGDPRYREPFDLFLIAGASPMLVWLWDTVFARLFQSVVARIQRLIENLQRSETSSAA